MQTLRHKQSYMDSLPTELVDIILQYVAVLSLPNPRKTKTETIFPYNAASVCTRWLAILKSNPELWEDVVIDVANNPAPFLDTLTLLGDSAEDIIEVKVFSSAKISPGLHEDDANRKRCENVRAKTVFENLEPSLARCWSISFDLIYQSSLPSAVQFLAHSLPQLRFLSLECQIYDLDDDTNDIEVDCYTQLEANQASPSRPSFPLKTSYPSLHKLNLTGFAFMELCRLAAITDFTECLTSSNSLRQLSVTHFKFLEPDSKIYTGSRSFGTFIKYLSEMNSHYSITLTGLSLGSAPTKHYEGTQKSKISSPIIELDSVSCDFIKTFFAHVVLPDNGTNTHIAFQRCDIIPSSVRMSEIYPSCLELVSIPFAPYYPTYNNLHHAISGFHSRQLLIEDCEGVTDELFNWLSSNPKKLRAPAYRMYSLGLKDCPGFSVKALRGFISARVERRPWNRRKFWQRFADDELFEDVPLSHISVEGKGPLLPSAETDWLLDLEEPHTTNELPDVKWDVTGHDVIGKDYYAHFDSARGLHNYVPNT